MSIHEECGVFGVFAEKLISVTMGYMPCSTEDRKAAESL